VSQSNVIFAFLAVAFLMLITLRGKLPTYMGFLLGEPKPAGTPTGSTTKLAMSSDFQEGAKAVAAVANAASKLAVFV
jgi:hypothetical protein